MTPSRQLEKLNFKIQNRLLSIRRAYQAAKIQDEDWKEEILAFSALELDNLIVGGLRCFMVSTLSATKSISNGKVLTSVSFGSEGEAGAFILSVINSVKYAKLGSPQEIPKKEEPTIRHPRDVRKVLFSANASNLPAFDTAISLNAGVFDSLATVRNYFAHRNHDTWRKFKNRAQSSGVFSVKRPEDFLNSRVRGLPLTVLDDWLDDTSIFFEYAMQ